MSRGSPAMISDLPENDQMQSAAIEAAASRVDKILGGNFLRFAKGIW
jgi:hypothetical protein